MSTEKSKKLASDKGKVKAIAEAMIDLPPAVDPPIVGSRTRIWKQDPSVKELALPRDVYIHAQVKEGPSDSQIGNAFGMPEGLRNADNNLKLSEAGDEVHDISQVFTGAIYDILADIFTANRNPRLRDDAITLYETGRYMAGLIIRSIEKSPANNATYADVAKAAIAIAKADGHPDYATLIDKHFTLREVLGAQAFAGHPDLAHLGIYPSRHGCCGTMQHLEYQT